jgi:type II secretory pathway pseudopilin PulG
MLKGQSRKAVAMVELIFAIVIMAIVLLSAPTLISQSVTSSYVGFQQEAINAAATHINVIMTKEWDQGNSDAQIDPRVLTIPNDNSGLESISDSEGRILARRAGTPENSYRKFATKEGATPNASLSSSFGSKGDDALEGSTPYDDIDDYHGDVARLKEVQGINDEDILKSNYKDRNMNMTTTVSYIRDTPSTGNYRTFSTLTFDNPFSGTLPTQQRNIKAISVVLQTDSTEEALQKRITLSAFMCNLGHYELETRDMP